MARRVVALILCMCYGLGAMAQVPKGVTFLYSQSLIFVYVKVNNAKGLLFLFDTGANTSVLDNATADRLQIFPQTSYTRDSVLGTAGKEPVRLIKVKSMQLGDGVVENMQLSRRDLSHFIKYNNNQKLDGVLGTDFLKKFAVTIDFKTRRIALQNTAVPVGKQAYIPFEMTEGIPKVEARFNDTLSTYLRYNSGVSLAQDKDVYINVSPAQWNKLKTADHKLTVQRYMTGTGVGGDVRLQIVPINKVQFRGMMVKFPFIIVQPSEGYFEKAQAIGFFGNNMLEKYNKVTVDFISRQIVFNTVRRSSLPF